MKLELSRCIKWIIRRQVGIVPPAGGCSAGVEQLATRDRAGASSMSVCSDLVSMLSRSPQLLAAKYPA